MKPAKSPHALLRIAEMRAADAYAIDHGVNGRTLMEVAGRAVAETVAHDWALRPVLVACGPGNNGGDGYVAARWLSTMGWPVRVAALSGQLPSAGDAAAAAQGWRGPVETLSPALLEARPLIVDALFGAGLSKPLRGDAATFLEAVTAQGVEMVAVDVPSGVDGDCGAVDPVTARAKKTITFHRKKIGHLLQPAREFCGEVVVRPIGIPDGDPSVSGARMFENGPALWREAAPQPRAADHKYRRGHVLVASGPPGRTGAARLAARGAARVGAGLVTLCGDVGAAAEHAAAVDSIQLRLGEPADVLGLDERFNILVIGPAFGTDADARRKVASALKAGRSTVLDADGLTVFAGDPPSLFRLLGPNMVLTPHEGEFARLFPDMEGSKLERACAAAKRAGGVVVLKGADTVIAAPDGRAAINGHASPWLATAGSGDVLAGVIGGLLAQGMETFDAACMAVWMHGDAALRLGPGMTADDLPDAMPAVLRGLAAAD